MKARERKTVHPEGFIVLTMKIIPEDDGLVGICEELGVSTCGDSLDEVLGELKALTLQHLNALEENGIRSSFFKKHGIRLYKTRAAGRSSQRPIPVDPDEIVTRQMERIPVTAGV